MRFRLMISAILLSSSLYAYADTYQYTVSVTSGGGSGTFSFDTSSILTGDTTVQASSLTYSSDPTVVSVFIDPDGPSCPNGNRGGNACVEFTTNGGEDFQGFPNAFTAPGSYNSTYDNLNLTITDLTPPLTATPEPSSIALLGTGLLTLIGTLRRYPR